MNALNTIWELTLDRPYNEGGKATHPTNMKGLVSGVHVEGTINDPRDVDKYWSVTIAFPWSGFKRYNGSGVAPEAGAEWRINFSRVQWPFKIDAKTGKYVRLPEYNTLDEHFEDNWVWSCQHAINMHAPKHWGRLVFS
jgi:hypothetical protein